MEFEFEKYNLMNTLDRARRVLREFHENLTEEQRKLFSLHGIESMPHNLGMERWCEKVEMHRFVDGLNKVIWIHENMPSSPDPAVPLKKKFEPVNYRYRK